MDITKCKGEGCMITKLCYRYTAKPSERQSYFVESPCKIIDNKFTCPMYWGAGYIPFIDESNSDNLKQFKEQEK